MLSIDGDVAGRVSDVDSVDAGEGKGSRREGDVHDDVVSPEVHLGHGFVKDGVCELRDLQHLLVGVPHRSHRQH